MWDLIKTLLALTLIIFFVSWCAKKYCDKYNDMPVAEYIGMRLKMMQHDFGKGVEKADEEIKRNR